MNFAASRSKHSRDPNTLALQRRIESTDRQIDALVYELPAGGLTAEEIKVVEGADENG